VLVLHLKTQSVLWTALTSAPPEPFLAHLQPPKKTRFASNLPITVRSPSLNLSIKANSPSIQEAAPYNLLRIRATLPATELQAVRGVLVSEHPTGRPFTKSAQTNLMEDTTWWQALSLTTNCLCRVPSSSTRPALNQRTMRVSPESASTSSKEIK